MLVPFYVAVNVVAVVMWLLTHKKNSAFVKNFWIKCKIHIKHKLESKK